jgi:type IV secretory pathway VirB4 component
LIALEAATRGVGTVIIDPEGEYQRLVYSLGGDYLRLAPDCGASLNVFDAGDAATTQSGGDAEVVGAVVDLVSVLCGDTLSEIERAHIDAAASTAVSRARGLGRAPVLGDCLNHLESAAPDVAVVLRRFTSGSLGGLFNQPTSVHLDAPVVGIGLRDLKDELVPAATLIVAEWLWSLVRRQRRRRHIVFDEVGLLCVHAPLRSLLVQLARRCRKYDASLVVATQNVGDLLGTEEGVVIATNPAIVLLGGHRGVETSRMQQAFSLTDEQRRMLERASRGEFLLLAGNRRLALHVEAPDLHHSLLTTAH